MWEAHLACSAGVLVLCQGPRLFLGSVGAAISASIVSFYSTLFGLAHAQPSVRPRLVQAASRRFGVGLGKRTLSLPRPLGSGGPGPGGILALAVFTSSLDLAQKVAAALDSASVACCERRVDLPNSQFSARSPGLRSCRCRFGAGLGFLTSKILCSEKNPLGIKGAPPFGSSQTSLLSCSMCA